MKKEDWTQNQDQGFYNVPQPYTHTNESNVLGNQPEDMPTPQNNGGKNKKNKTNKVLATLLVIGVFVLGGVSGLSFGRNQERKEMTAVMESETNKLKEENSLLTIENEELNKQVLALTPTTDKNTVTQTTDVLSRNTNIHSVADVIAKASPSVVSINTLGSVQTNWFNQTFQSQSAGSGIVFNENDEKIFIVTNYHVIRQADEVTISFDDNIQISAHYIGGVQEMDLAVIGVTKKDLADVGITEVSLAVFADSDNVQMGDAAIAIGNALGQGKSATYGIVSATDRTIITESNTEVAALQTDAAINGGNSGGALIDENGNVIGVNTAKLASNQIEGMGYAIPSNTVQEIVTQILSTGKVEKPYIGISILEIDDQLMQAYNFPAKGLYINGVYQNSTAHLAGVQAGDIITEINGTAVLTKEDADALMTSVSVGDTMTFKVLRVTSRTGDVNELILEAPVQNATTDPSF